MLRMIIILTKNYMKNDNVIERTNALMDKY